MAYRETLSRPPNNVRAQILDAAIAVLKEHGERAMTQTRVAQVAGIPQGHLTYYFPKKSDLVLGVASRFAEVSGAELVAFFAERAELPPRARLIAYAKHLIVDRDRTRMLLGLLVMSETEPELSAILERNALMLRTMLATAISRPPEDPAVDLLLALLWGLGLHEFVLRTDQTDAFLARAFALLELED